MTAIVGVYFVFGPFTCALTDIIGSCWKTGDHQNNYGMLSQTPETPSFVPSLNFCMCNLTDRTHIKEQTI